MLGAASPAQPSPLLPFSRPRRRLGARARRSETPCFPTRVFLRGGELAPSGREQRGGTVPGPPPSPPQALAGGGSGRTAAAPLPRAAPCRRQQPGGAAGLAREPPAAAGLAQQDPAGRTRSPRGELPPAQLAPSSPLRRVGTRRGCGTRWGSANICGLALQEKSKGNERGYCSPAALPASRPAFLKPVLGYFRIWMNSGSWGCRKHGAGSRALGKCSYLEQEGKEPAGLCPTCQVSRGFAVGEKLRVPVQAPLLKIKLFAVRSGVLKELSL